MKKIMKKWWLVFLIIGIIVIISIITIIINMESGIGTSGISKEEFEEIEIGMSQFEVHSIIDKLDEWDNDEVFDNAHQEISRTKENDIYQYKYKYYGEKRGYAMITYKADYSKGDLFVLPTVIKKEQFNLK